MFQLCSFNLLFSEIKYQRMTKITIRWYLFALSVSEGIYVCTKGGDICSYWICLEILSTRRPLHSPCLMWTCDLIQFANKHLLCRHKGQQTYLLRTSTTAPKIVLKTFRIAFNNGGKTILLNVGVLAQILSQNSGEKKQMTCQLLSTIM